MTIQRIDNTRQNTVATTQTPARNPGNTSGQNTAATVQEKVSIGGPPAEALTYGKPRAIPDNLAAMLEESDQKVQELLDLIRPLIEQQGLNLAKVASGEQQLSVDQGTIDEARAAIGEDGEWGVTKVSERILSFAKFAMGDDPAQMQKIRDAIELGFSQAKEMLGGTLPQISQETYDTIMSELDKWEKNGIPAGDTVWVA